MESFNINFNKEVNDSLDIMIKEKNERIAEIKGNDIKLREEIGRYKAEKLFIESESLDDESDISNLEDLINKLIEQYGIKNLENRKEKNKLQEEINRLEELKLKII